MNFIKSIIFSICLIGGTVYCSEKLILEKQYEVTDFSYLKFSVYPSSIDKFSFGSSLGYRKTLAKSHCADMSINLEKNELEEVQLFAKVNHLFYFFKSYEKVSSYLLFGVKGGITYLHLPRESGKYVYSSLVDGNLGVGLELDLNKYNKQFIELIYAARSKSLQFSIGIGF